MTPNEPRITLLIVGAGPVGQAVAKLAADLDFDLWILDDRPDLTSRERFPTAQRLLTGDIALSLNELAPRITPSVYAIIVTRDPQRDLEALFQLAQTLAPPRPLEEAVGYVGLIGKQGKLQHIFEELSARGVTAAALAQVRAPLGLPIGSRTVAEIAVSIVAELIARRNLGTSDQKTANN